MPAFSPLRSHRQRRRLRAWLLPGIIIVIALCGVGVWALTQRDKQDTAIVQDPKSTDSSNPLHNRTLYKDGSRQVAMAARQYPELQAIASQPGATWLIGPSVSDQQADRDIAAVRRTS
ncbi:MAG TPA: hypothetical protein VD735_03395, partial [Candidatus Saccharimonadales bacterium]|nr:hypothetical protein [Candidatus Saccharimonadales bacterium]